MMLLLLILLPGQPADAAEQSIPAWAATQYAAEAAFAAGDPRRALKLLDSVPGQERGWEWRWRRRRFIGGDFTLTGHSAVVQTVSFTPDGKGVVSGDADGKFIVWDAVTGADKGRFERDDRSAQHASIVHNHRGDQMAAIRTFRNGPRSESRVLISKGEPWSNVVALESPGNAISSIAFDDQGRWLAAGQAPGITKVWDVAMGAVVATLKSCERPMLSSDGRFVAGRTVRAFGLWDVATGEQRATFFERQEPFPQLVAVGPGGGRVALGWHTGALAVWDASTRVEHDAPAAHAGSIDCLIFSPDGERLISGDRHGVIRVWDAETLRELAAFRGHVGYVTSLGCSPDGARLVSGSYDRSVKLWSLPFPKQRLPLQRYAEGASRVAFSPDGERLAVGLGGGTINVSEVWSGAEVAAIKGQRRVVNGLAFTYDGRQLVGCSQDRSLNVWDANTGAVVRSIEAHKTNALGFALSRDGKRMATSSADQSIKIWEIASGKLLHTIPGVANNLAFNHDGSMLASDPNNDEESAAFLWDVEKGTKRASLKAKRFLTRSLAFSPDGTQLACGSLFNPIKIFDAATGAERLTLRGHAGPVVSLAFSPDGKRLASGSRDTTVRIWDVSTGVELATLNECISDVVALQFSPDGNLLVACSQMESTRLWDARPVEGAADAPNELAFRRGLAVFRPAEAARRREIAKSPYAKAFWSSRLALHEPARSEHWSRLRAECRDARAWSLAAGVAEAGLRAGPNAEATATLDWARERMKEVVVAPSKSVAPPAAATKTEMPRTPKPIERRLPPPPEGAPPAKFELLVLRTDHLPVAITLPDDPAKRRISAVSLDGEISDDGGKGTVTFDEGEPTFNAFGDATVAAPKKSPPFEVDFRPLGRPGVDRQDQSGRPRQPEQPLYQIVFRDGSCADRLMLRLSNGFSGPHRLLIDQRTERRPGGLYGSFQVSRILELFGRPEIKSPLPDAPRRDAFLLNTTYAIDVSFLRDRTTRFRNIGVHRGADGKASLDLDPNYISLDPFGEGGSSTLMGHSPLPASLVRSPIQDPQNHGRELYKIVPLGQGENTFGGGTFELVLASTIEGPHRLLSREGGALRAVAPLRDTMRDQQLRLEAELRQAPADDRQAIKALREAIGDGFHVDIKDGVVAGLSVSAEHATAVQAIPPRLKSLKRLAFSGYTSSGPKQIAVLDQIGGLRRLESIDLHSIANTDMALKDVGKLNRLERLTLMECQGLSDEGMMHLRGLGNLRHLRIGELYRRGKEPKVSEAGWGAVGGLELLETLDLMGLSATDTSLARLQGLRNLRRLNLAGEGVTDTGIMHLKDLPRLEHLHLFMTKTTPEGERKLKEQNPILRIGH
jgi:WD40 repeat protein